MSKIEIEIDFNTIKYNLYEILNVSPDADDTKIKKSFVKIIKNFHPDKNSELEEDIYYHIILANQILLNKESRKKYDKFIDDNVDTYFELKEKFSKSIKNIDDTVPDKGTSLNLFNYKISELNKKHGYDNNLDSISITERFNKAKEKRNSGVNEIKIEKEIFVDTKDFNKKFENNKIDGKYKSQIIEYSGTPCELSTYTIGENYTNLADIDKLYIEDSIQSSKYSSLDRAFSLQPSHKHNNNNISYDERMKEYQSQTKNINNMKPTDFSSKKFNEL
jgi:curved DNA-binding protein CbpA